MKKTKKKATKKKAKYVYPVEEKTWGATMGYWAAKAAALQIEEVRARFR